MGNNLHSIFFTKWPLFISKHRLLFSTLLILTTIFVAMGLPKVSIDMSIESFFLNDDPVKVTYQKFREKFGSDEFIFIVYKAKDGNIFSEPSLKALSIIHDTLSSKTETHRDDPDSPFSKITDVTSLMNVSYLEGDQDTLRSRAFVQDAKAETDAQRSVLKKEAENHPNYIPSLLNNEGDFAVIVIDTNLGVTTVDSSTTEEGDGIPSFDGDEADGRANPVFIRPQFWDYQSITNAIQATLDDSLASKHLQFYPVGNPVIMKFLADVFTTEVTFLSTASIIFIILIFFLLFRSIRAVLSALAIVVTAIVWTLGICGWMKIDMTLMINVIIFLTLSVGVADAVHILSGYMYLRSQNKSHQKAFKEVFRTSGLACFLTSVTTMVGLFSLLVVPVVPLKIFGIFAGVGVFFAFLFTLIILPLTIPVGKTIGKIKPGNRKLHVVQRIIRLAEPLVYKAPVTGCILFLLVSLLFFYGLTKVRVDTNNGKLINHRNIIRQNMDVVETHFGGTMNMEILIETHQSDGVKNPKLLKTISELQTYLEKEHGDLVVSTYSLADAVKESFQALNENRDEMYLIPPYRQALSQTLLLFEMAAPDEQVKLVTESYDATRISIRIKDRGSYEYIPFMAACNKKIDTLFTPHQKTLPDLDVKITGVFALTMKLYDFVSWSQIKTFTLALSVISILFIFVFRSLKGGLISIIPNLFPIVVSFGMMGFMGYSLDLDTLLVAPIAIGIAVDDTIHFLTRYRLEQSAGAKPKIAVKHTYREVGQAMIFTTIILSSGFLMFTFSQHNGLSHFGLLSATAIIAALISDLFFLPRLCILTNLTFGKPKSA